MWRRKCPEVSYTESAKHRRRNKKNCKKKNVLNKWGTVPEDLKSPNGFCNSVSFMEPRRFIAVLQRAPTASCSMSDPMHILQPYFFKKCCTLPYMPRCSCFPPKVLNACMVPAMRTACTASLFV